MAVKKKTSALKINDANIQDHFSKIIMITCIKVTDLLGYLLANSLKMASFPWVRHRYNIFHRQTTIINIKTTLVFQQLQ